MAEHALISIATDAAKVLAQSVAARALDEIYLAWGFKNQLKRLNQKFEYIQAFLEDASDSKYAEQSKQVNVWVQNVKNTAYLADNVLDEYVIEIFRRKMDKRRYYKRFRNLLKLTSTSRISFPLVMAHKVKEILSLFDEIDKEALNIGLNRVDIAARAVPDANLIQIREHAAVNASEFVGRMNDRETLFNHICSPLNERRGLSTVAIVGIGGVGKTTLARHLYEHDRICGHFYNKKIWICVSENFDINRLLNEMVESVTTVKSELTNNNAIIRKLEEELKGKKVLIVLDDVWYDKENLWQSLQNCMLSIGIIPGSVILTTTRSDKVAKAAGAVFKHELIGLSEDESWSLLHQIVIKRISQINPSMEEVGRRIVVEKCKGVPLAIKVIGGLLRSKRRLHEWEAIEESELWDLEHGRDEIFSSLLLSFHNLPASVKQCFAYCAMTLKGVYAYKSEVIGLWLSQGYLRNDKRKNKTIEEIGEKYLKILLSNLLVEEYVSKVHGMVFYRVHGLVFDLIVYVCGTEFIKKAKDLHENGCCRHLVFDSVENKVTKDFPPEEALIKLRTLRFTGGVQWDLLIHTKYLRTLFLDRTGITAVSPAIESLKHLRYLDVSYNPISSLPDSICELYQLQTLILLGCNKMKKLPKVLNRLVNLRHVLTSNPMFACKGLRRLVNLQSLPCISLDDCKDGWTIDELGDLQELRDVIHILRLEYVKDMAQARKAGLAGKVNVTNLTLSWGKEREESSGGVRDKDVLEGLETHPNITSLEVQNFNGEAFPTWISRMAVLTDGQRRTQLSSLKEVKLLNCNRCQTLPTLGQLRSLKCLILSGLNVKCIDLEFYGSEEDLQTSSGVSFESLVELEISGFKELRKWMVPQLTTFPQLEILRVTECDQLESVPALCTTSLRSLKLTSLKGLESIDIIKDSTALTSLTIDMLPQITNLPNEIENCRKLQVLNVTNCAALKSLPSGLKFLVSLRSLVVKNCQCLTSLPEGRLLHGLSSLLELEFVDCPRLRMKPACWEGCTTLESLVIKKCSNIKVSPKYVRKFLRLTELRISYSTTGSLKSTLAAARGLSFLKILEIQGFNDEKEMTDYFSDMTLFTRLSSLTHLTLRGCPNITTLPQQLQLLTQITTLYICDFKDLTEIPNWICNLSSLDSLGFFSCTGLESLPSKSNLERLTGLKNLIVHYCPLLNETYAKDVGSQWDDVSHIQQFVIV